MARTPGAQLIEAQLHQLLPLPGNFRTCRETFIKAQPGETPNDRNDRAIRVAAAWYTQRIPAMRIVLLSNDVDNRRKAAEAGITTMSVQVTSVCCRELLTPAAAYLLPETNTTQRFMACGTG